MTRKTRRIIFLLCVFIFVVATPGVLLYASGYSFNWKQNRLIKTGSFYFDSLPKEAKILLNNELYDVTPAYIGRLLPNRYAIKISKDGYSDWYKNLEILPQVATEARSIFLAPKEPKISKVADHATSALQYFLNADQEIDEQKIRQNASSTIEQSAGWTVFEDNVYYLQKSNMIFYKTDLSGQSNEQISATSIADNDVQFQIKISGEHFAIFVPSNKLYLFNNNTKSFDFLADDVMGAEFSSDNGKLLFWTAHEIWVLWLADVWSQPYRKTGEKELITRLSDKISQAIWFSPTNEHIIYAIKKSDNQTQLKLTELDSRDAKNTYDIYFLISQGVEVYTGNVSEIYFNSNGNLLYILADEKIYSIQLITK